MDLVEHAYRLNELGEAINRDYARGSQSLAGRLAQVCEAVAEALAQVNRDLKEACSALECDCPSCINKRRS
jgi:hypothetical protein